MAVEVPVILAAAVLISAPLVAESLNIYRRQFINGRRYPRADLGFLPLPVQVILEEKAKTHVRYLMDQAMADLYISTNRLSARVWDHDLAQGLEVTLKDRPQLKLHLLTGPEVVGFEDGTHPFYNACRELAGQDRVRFAVYDGSLPLEGVLSDHTNVYRVYRGSQAEEGELVPALWTYRDYDSSLELLEQTGRFLMEFNSLWQRADLNSRPTIKAAA